MSGEPDAVRAALRAFPTGVTIVTTREAGVAHGFTANAFASVSLDPPSILLCVNRRAKSHALIARAGRFCVNVLDQGQRELAERFARSGDERQFDDVPWEPTPSGMPRLAGSLAWLDCVLDEEHSVATHTIFVGAVAASGVAAGRPLGYFDGGFRDFGVALRERDP